MTRTTLIAFLLMGFLFGCDQPDLSPPNVVIIFLDDAGYHDMQPFSDRISTPSIKQLAEEGVTFTNFYVPQGICSASRAALVTGCYPGRTGVFGAHGPRERGLEPAFPTMGELFGSAGYATAFFGKWHLGDQPDTRPDARGFDETFGLMYSNDMWKHHPENPEYWGRYPIQLWENGEVIVEEVDFEHQHQLTRWYTEHAVDFISRHKEKPFLLYVPHSMPHVPIFTSEDFAGKTGQGLYADVMTEIDWSVGQIMEELKRHQLDENTVVILTSDNGPWTSYGNHAGLSPFREAKGTSFDGGNRSPFIIRYPAGLSGGIASDRTFFSIDLLPTLAELAGIQLPDSVEVDGKNVWELISGNQSFANPHRYYPLSTGKRFEGIMSGDGQWKLHLPHPYRHLIDTGYDGAAGTYETWNIELSLFNMKDDPMESTNVIDQYPEVARMMQEMAAEHQERFYSE